MPYGDGTHVESIDSNLSAVGRMYYDFDNVSDDLPCDAGINYVARKEDMTYEELCTLEGMIALFNHDKSLDDEITHLKERCLLNTINDLEERTSDVLTLMLYVKSERVPADKVDELLNEAIKNPMSLLKYIDEADKSKYDVNISKYVEDVEGEW